ncbi:MAG: branched-chain amino acid ABC transporter ATP-binding protein/permease [Hyphomicrobiales bacterium]|nr:branched-chain amino acid ABC transporter ATP-binding protein/permease [Hyphomicrobiales bacterium]
MNVAKRYAPHMFALLVLAVPFTGLLPAYWVTLFDYIGISTLVALGLVLLTGVGGMTSFGQAAFVGFGAYSTAVLTTQFGLSPWLSLPISLAVTAFAALLIGAVTVRLSGHYLPLGTIAWGIAFFYLFGNMESLGAHDGMSGLPALSIGSFALTDPRNYFIAVWAAVVLAMIASRNLLDSRIGRGVRVLRRGSMLAESFGASAPKLKLLLFVYAATLAGLAGWLYAHFQRAVSPGPFGVVAGTEYLLMAVLGGSGRIWGALLGATAVTVLRDQLQDALPHLVGHTGNYETIVFGAILVLILQTAPRGLWPLIAGPPAPPAAPENAGGGPLATRDMPPHGAPMLEARALVRRFGGLVAVNDVSFDLKAGEILALIGPNGAGKSTTFNLITGAHAFDSGALVFRGHEYAAMTPAQSARNGVGRTFQHVQLLSDMSVLENVAFGGFLRGKAGAVSAMTRLDRSEEAQFLAEAERQIARVGLADHARKPAGSLALGQMRLVEIARALVLDPYLLLLDEPAAGLRVNEKKALAGLLRDLRKQGMSVLLVEHDMDFVMSLADRIVVLDFGVKIAEGPPAVVRDDARVREAYLGEAV